ncbi:hypothetical protein P9314_16735 [Paenibacillus validus]|uniref:hypothetical protein n=1 Tax=Paenibacillus validus TaxID=44253 RepID=UPI000FD6F0D1|nr:hypothetical protein [Paenibacillus validus]MED4602314.1 hypothetical protein [Paenibacillus validus]MED4607193.1 hypothetical protein [Paenibacillus validus]
MNQMYIRHTVGSRLLLDSVKHTADFDIQPVDGQWQFVIRLADDKVAEEVLKFRDELNLFVVDDEKPDVKTWYYSSDGRVDYDKAGRTLTIIADARLDYNV